MPIWVYIGGWLVTVAGFIVAGFVAWRNVNVQIGVQQKVFEENHLSEIRKDFQGRLERFSDALEKHKSEDTEAHNSLGRSIAGVQSGIAKIEGRLEEMGRTQ